jgi:hypothetical protein
MYKSSQNRSLSVFLCWVRAVTFTKGVLQTWQISTIIVRRDKWGSTTIYIGMNGIISTTHTERRYFLGQFKGPWLFETAKNWFQRLGTEKGGVWFEGCTLPKSYYICSPLRYLTQGNLVDFPLSPMRGVDFRLPISLQMCSQNQNG